MYTKQRLLSSAIFLACSSISAQIQAALPVDPVLNFDPGVIEICGTSTPCVKTGSYFGMDTNGNGVVVAPERTALAIHDGLRLSTATIHDADATQPASGSHGGVADGSETPGIDAPWSFFGNVGMHYTANPAKILSASGNTASIDFSGWGVTWNGIPAINMGAGTWGTNADGVADLVCGVDCAVGDTFTLDYTATVPANDPSGFQFVKYNLHLIGTIGGFNVAPVTASYTRSVTSDSAVPTPGGPEAILLHSHVTDANGEVFTSSTPTITNPSANIATNCSPTSITANNDGTATFPACPNGVYTFDYAFTDSYGATSNTSTVTVTAAGDPAPNAENDTAIADGVTPLIIDVLANDTDNNIDATSVVVVATPTHGGVSVNATTGAITYTADANYSGTDTFTYTVDDLAAQTSNIATVTVTVNAFNTPATSATFAVGTTATAAGSTTGIVTLANIGIVDAGTFPEDDIAQSCIGGCFDFILSGITPGTSASIVLPLSTAVPAKADPDNSIVYRKLLNGRWVNFDTTVDTYRSAPGTVTGSDVSCPPATSTDYVGLTTGHRCLLLTITDGGPNDADGLADGSIADPGGLAEITRVVSTDGCSMTGNTSQASDHAEWLLVAGFMGLLGWFGISRRKA